MFSLAPVSLRQLNSDSFYSLITPPHPVVSKSLSLCGFEKYLYSQFDWNGAVDRYSL